MIVFIITLTILIAIAFFWKRIIKLIQIVEPARASFLGSLLVFAFYIDEGQDILRRLLFEDSNKFSLYIIHVLLLGFCTFLLGLNSWGWARFLLRRRFEKTHDVHFSPSGDDTIRRRFRRLCCGLLPLGLLGGALVKIAIGLPPHSPHQLTVYALVGMVIAIGGVLWAIFEGQHVKAERLKQTAPVYRSLSDLHAKGRGEMEWRVVLFSTCSVVVLFILFTFLHFAALEQIGSATILILAIASWIVAGNWLVYAGRVTHFPMFTTLLILAMVFSCHNDNHHIRTVQRTNSYHSPSLSNAVVNWHSNLVGKCGDAKGQQQPMFLVATAGGGIRAAYWTAVILGELQDRDPSFADHLFAISGVSGGSLGAVIFDAVRAYDANVTNMHHSIRERMDHDFLAADLAKLAYGDLFQRVWPWPVEHFDRARSLEDAWMAGWTNQLQDKTLDHLFTNSNSIFIPHLVLNGTSVETGKRILTTDLALINRDRDGHNKLVGEMTDVLLADNLYSNHTLRLSTAAHQSARFPVFSPSGSFPIGLHIVDGGYFENSGATTISDLVRPIRVILNANHWSSIKIKVILIDNDPIGPSNQLQPLRFLPETMSIVEGFLKTRDARASFAVMNLIERPEASSIAFHLYTTPSKNALLPLGWTLSDAAMDEMDRQLITSNSLSIASVLECLNGPKP